MKKSKIQKIKWAKNLKLSDWAIERGKVEGIGTQDIVRIGGSDVSVCTGSNTFKCPQRLYYHLTGLHTSFTITERTLAGHLQEPIIQQHFEAYNTTDKIKYLIDTQDKVRHRKLSKANYFLLHEDYPNSFISLDYTIEGNQFSALTGDKYVKGTPVEMKTTDKFYYMMWKDGITQAYYDQIQTQMLISGKDMCVFLVYVMDSREYKEKEFYADKERQAFIVEKVNEFAERVKVGKMALQGMSECEHGSEDWIGFKEIFDRATPDAVAMEDNVTLQKELNGIIDKDAEFMQGDEEDYNLIERKLKITRLENKLKEETYLINSKLLQKLDRQFRGIKVGDNKFTFTSGKCLYKKEKQK